MSARAFAVFIAVLAVVGLLAYGLLKKSSDSLAIGDPVPDATAQLPNLDGNGVSSLADYRGRWVLVNVWASWCVPAAPSRPPSSASTRHHRGPDFTILGIDSNDLTDDALAFERRYRITYPQLRDGSGDFSEGQLGTTGVPESFLVNPQGKLVLHRLGPVSDDYLRSNVAPYLDGTARQRRLGLIRVAPVVIALALAPRPRRIDARRWRRSRRRPKTTLPDVEDEVMCPVCGTALNLSSSPQADRERVFIRQRDRRGQDQGPDRGRARGPVRNRGPGRAPEVGLRPDRMAGPGRSDRARGDRDRLRPEALATGWARRRPSLG